MTEKTPNYTNAQTLEIVEAYAKGETQEEREQILQDLSTSTGRAVRGLIAKLVSEKVYVKKVYKSKTKKDVETKETIVQSLADIFAVTVDKLNGLEKATKPTLEFLRLQFLTVAAQVEALERGDEPDAETSETSETE